MCVCVCERESERERERDFLDFFRLHSLDHEIRNEFLLEFSDLNIRGFLLYSGNIVFVCYFCFINLLVRFTNFANKISEKAKKLNIEKMSFLPFLNIRYKLLVFSFCFFYSFVSCVFTDDKTPRTEKNSHK